MDQHWQSNGFGLLHFLLITRPKLPMIILICARSLKEKHVLLQKQNMHDFVSLMGIHNKLLPLSATGERQFRYFTLTSCVCSVYVARDI